MRHVDPDGHGVKDWLKAAVQVAKDTAVGAAKPAWNTVAETASLVNVGVDAAISPVTDFRFGRVTTAQASTPGEKSAMTATDIVTVVAGGVGIARGIIRGASRLARAGAAVETGEAAQAAGKSSRVEKIVETIRKEGIQVKVNPKSAATAQEGNVTLSAGGNTRVNIRVETHPLKPNGPPVRHANVEVIRTVRGKHRKIENTHITQ